MNTSVEMLRYLSEPPVHKTMDRVIANIRANCDYLRSVDRSFIVRTVLIMLLAGVVSLKHEGFQEEREWRTVYAPNRWPSSLMESGTEVVSGVPQIVFKIPMDVTKSEKLADLDFSRIFDRLILGPSPYPWPMYQAFVDALKKAGVENAQDRVFVSGIPIRG